MHISEMVMNIACMECNLSSWDFFYIGHSDLEAAISAALHEFCSK